MRLPIYLSLLSLTGLFSGCGNNPQTTTTEEANTGLSLTTADFGTTAEGPATLYTLKNKNGMQVEITNYGGIITRLFAPDRNGQLTDVVLGFDNVGAYEKDHPYFGAIIGRYGNRIAKAKFSLDGQTYTLAANNGVNTLHGGPMGFHKHLWQSKPLTGRNYVGLELSRVSKDGEEGYPGDLEVRVSYLLNDSNELIIEYKATTSKPTVINLTNHSYFNLKGAGNGDILGHELMIDADAFTPVDSTLIPTGVLAPVEGTAFDFRTPTAIGKRVNADEEQIRFGKGYDHNFVLNKKGTSMAQAASVYEPTSGRVLEVWTTEPGLQFYCGNFLNSTDTGKGGIKYAYRTGFCLETQHYPDSPNHPDFPSTLLKPGEKYETQTVYKFSVK